MNDKFFYDLELIKRDQAQWDAYQSMSDTVVLAGPGSGKTRVLSLKAVSLAGTVIVPPAGLVCISYSRETVRELKTRLNEYGYKPGTHDFIGTIHSFSLMHILRPFGHLYPQYGIKYPIKIAPKEVLDQIYDQVLEKLKVNHWTLKFIEINRHRSLALDGLSKIKKTSTDLVQQGAQLFEQALLKTPYLDFISIINLSARIVQEQEFVRRILEAKYPWILVDEYQDLGKGLHELVIELFFNSDIKIYAVGDINQSIYGFNGGYPEFLEELMNNDDIKGINLNANYRSTQHVIEASTGTLPPPAPQYIAKKRVDDADFTFITCEEELSPQFEIVAKRVIPELVKKGIKYNEIAVIVGSNPNVKSMCRELKGVEIPFYIAKWDFENSNVVVWLQDCAAWCINQSRISFDGLFSFWRSLLIQHNDYMSTWEKIRLKVFFHGVMQRAMQIEDLLLWLKLVIGELGLPETLKDSEQFPNEVGNLEILINEVDLRYLRGASVKRFAELGKPDNEVTITTRHSAKGLEFEAVVLLGMEEGKFPYSGLNALEIEEAQRLCYVCVSRAKKTCVLIRSKYYPDRWDASKKVSYAPSRFWVSLHSKFGTQQNTFDAANYPSQ